MAATPTGKGYWLLAADGGIFTFGDAVFHGAGPGRVTSPVVDIEASPTGNGYWVQTVDGNTFAFGDALDLGSIKRSGLKTAPAVGLAAS